MTGESLRNLIGFTSEEIAALPVFREEPGYRARQVASWIYRRSAQGFEAMSNLSVDLRRRLGAAYVLRRPDLVAERASADGSATKFLLQLSDGLRIEAVLIREPRRDTICISTQAGCALGCRFCATARMGLLRSLTPHEILSQVLILGDRLRAAGATGHGNLVFMGMGEPLANYAAVVRSLRVLQADFGLGIGKRRITISTAGLAPQMRRLAREDVAVRLALSLNATTDEVRSALMPINRRFPIAAALAALAEYRRVTGSRTTLEYVLLRGVNDTLADAERLARFARDADATINLIVFNPHPHSDLEPTPVSGVRAFRDALLPLAPTVTVRESRGADIQAACGQLVDLQPPAPRARAPQGAAPASPDPTTP